MSGSGNYLSSITGCNITYAEMVIEQKNIKAQGIGYLNDNDLRFNIYFDNGINLNEPVCICIYPVIDIKVTLSACNIQLYLKAENIKLKSINMELKIFEADFKKFRILQR